jgi:hypothetical protein
MKGATTIPPQERLWGSLHGGLEPAGVISAASLAASHKHLKICPSTMPTAAMPKKSAFKSGREFAAWIGLVPRQNSTGGNRKPQQML